MIVQNLLVCEWVLLGAYNRLWRIRNVTVVSDLSVGWSIMIVSIWYFFHINYKGTLIMCIITSATEILVQYKYLLLVFQGGESQGSQEGEEERAQKESRWSWRWGSRHGGSHGVFWLWYLQKGKLIWDFTMCSFCCCWETVSHCAHTHALTTNRWTSVWNVFILPWTPTAATWHQGRILVSVYVNHLCVYVVQLTSERIDTNL